MVRIAASALLGLWLSISPGCKADESTATDRIRVGVSSLRISLPVFVAIEADLFAKAGLTNIELSRYQTAQPLVTELSAGRLDAGGFAAYPIISRVAQQAEVPLAVTSTLVEDADHRLSYVLGRRGDGLRFPRDAAGKTIAILPTIAYDRWLRAILTQAGIDPNSVRIVPVDPPFQGQQLQTGSVDMVFTNDPAATAILQSGDVDIIDDGPPCAKRLAAEFAFGSFVIRDGFARKRPEQARKLADVIDQAIDLIRQDHDAAITAMLKYLPREHRTHGNHYPRARYRKSSEVTPDAIERELTRQQAWGILTSDAPVRLFRGRR